MIKRLGPTSSWQVDPGSFKGDSRIITNFMEQLTALKASEKFDNVTDFAEFGLQYPERVIYIDTVAGQQQRLAIGERALFKSQTYVRVNTENAVYLVPNELIANIRVSKNDLRSRDILSMPTQKIDKVIVQTGKRRYQFAKRADGDWQYSATGKVISADYFVDLSHYFHFANVEKIVEDNPVNIGKYGLQRPRYRIIFEGSDQQAAAIALGGAANVDESALYIMSTEVPTVFTASGGLMGKLVYFENSIRKELI
jgi:hypothetical protein